MIYTANITTESKTWKNNLKKTVIHVTKGLVYKVEFYFPPGPAGLMGVAVFDGLYQVWPSTVGEFFMSDNETISFNDMFLKDTAPFELQCYTYNEDDTNDHMVAIRIGLVSDDVFMARFLPTKGQAYFKRLRSRMLSEREQRAREQQEMRAGRLPDWLLAKKPKSLAEFSAR